MKRFVSSVFAIAAAFSIPTATRAGLVGISFDAASAQNAFVAIDPGSGTSAVLNHFVFSSGYWNSFCFQVSHQSNTAFAISGDEKLYSFDAITGAIVAIVPLSQSVQTLTPDGNGMVGIRYNPSANLNEFVSINTATGEVRTLSGVSFPMGYIADTFTIHPATGTAFVLTGNGQLYEFSPATGVVLSTATLSQSVQTLRPSGNDFVGVRYNSVTAKNEFVSINRTTGSVTTMTAVTFSSGYYTSSSFTVDASTNTAFVASGDAKLYAFSVDTGSIISIQQLPFPIQALADATQIVLDADGDGVPDVQDHCADSDMRPTIWIGNNDSGVTNRLSLNPVEQGCTLSDLIAKSLIGVHNQGEGVSSVGRLTKGWARQGIITDRERAAIQRSVAAK